ncbi:MAG: hypothetical protein AAB336_14195, partial [Acidobacteriota bacterium]
MKKSLPLLIVCFFFFAISIFAQEARKIDEFGDIPCGELLNKSDAANQERYKTPNSKLFIIF